MFGTQVWKYGFYLKWLRFFSRFQFENVNGFLFPRKYTWVDYEYRLWMYMNVDIISGLGGDCIYALMITLIYSWDELVTLDVFLLFLRFS